MTKQAKPVLADGGVYSCKTSTSQHFFVNNLMLPSNSKNMAEASLVKGVNFLFCIVDRVHFSLPYSRVLQTQARRQPTLCGYLT